MKEIDWYMGDSASPSRMVFAYDRKWNAVETVHYSAENAISSRVKNKYDASDHLIESESFNKEGYRSDDTRRVVETAQYRADGTLQNWSEMVRDAAGRTTEKRELNPDGSLKQVVRWESEVDSNQLPVRTSATECKPGTGGQLDCRPIGRIYYTFTYYPPIDRFF